MRFFMLSVQLHPAITFIIAAVCILGTLMFLPRVGLIAVTKRWLTLRRRILIEDALKAILTATSENQSTTPNTLAGTLGLSQQATMNLVERLEAIGLVHSTQDILQLTAAGKDLALHVLRAHRLWERYLVDEARLPLAGVHKAADRAEHYLEQQELEALEDHLGHPRTDPHGDPIPTPDGKFDPQRRTGLNDWPVNHPARVVHIEDEPPETMNQILAAELRPDTFLTVIAKDSQRITFKTDFAQHSLPPALAAKVHVRQAAEKPIGQSNLIQLAQLKTGQEARVASLTDQCRGLTRRRLMDLGLTSGAQIKAQLSSPFGSARGYRIRGTLIALRTEQAQQVLVSPLKTNSDINKK